MLPVPSPQQAEALRRLDDDIIAAKAVLTAETPERKAARDAWEADLRRVAWTVLTPLSATSAGGATLAVQSDGSLLASGANTARGTHALPARIRARVVTAFRLETIPDASLPKKGSGRSPDGNFV